MADEMDNHNHVEFDARTLDWAATHIPARWLIRLLALAGYFMRHPELAFFAVDLKRDITNPTPEAGIQNTAVPDRVRDTLRSLDFALGAAFVYTAQRYALLYPHRPTTLALESTAQQFREKMERLLQTPAPALENYGDIPYVACMPDEIIAMSQEQREHYQKIYDDSSLPNVDEKSGLPRPAYFLDFRCLAPAEAWTQLAISAAVGSSFVEPGKIHQLANGATSNGATGGLDAALQLHWTEAMGCHEAPNVELSIPDIQKYLAGLHADWFREFVSTLPVPNWLIAAGMGLTEPIPQAERMTHELLLSVLGCTQPATPEPALPDHVQRWIEPGTTADMNRPLVVRQKYDEMWREYLQRNGVQVSDQ